MRNEEGDAVLTYPSIFAQAKLDNPSDASFIGWLWMFIGGLFMLILTVARHRLPWWPFHPLGYALGTGWTMAHIWFSIFLAWIFKTLILKFGDASRPACIHQVSPERPGGRRG